MFELFDGIFGGGLKLYHGVLVLVTNGNIVQNILVVSSSALSFEFRH